SKRDWSSDVCSSDLTRGMTMMRLPLTVWGIFMATILALLAFPALFVSAIMMTLDQTLGTSFFMPALVSRGEHLGYNGGSPILFRSEERRVGKEGRSG